MVKDIERRFLEDELRNFICDSIHNSSQYYFEKNLHQAYGLNSFSSKFALFLRTVENYNNSTEYQIFSEKILDFITSRNSDGGSIIIDYVASKRSYNLVPETALDQKLYWHNRLKAILDLGLLRFYRPMILLHYAKKVLQEYQNCTEIGLQQSIALSKPVSKISNLVSNLTSITNESVNRSLEGVCIVGFAKSTLGLGEDARRLADVLLTINCRLELIDVSPKDFCESDEDVYALFFVEQPSTSIVIFCMPIIEIARFLKSGRSKSIQGRYLIACSPWELNELPEETIFILDHINEVWCASQFQLETYRNMAEDKVFLVPLYIETASPIFSAQVDTIFDGKFTFGFAFDFNSTVNRKNPIGLIKAFRSAFSSEQADVRLVIKTINADMHNSDFQELASAIANDRRVILLDGAISSSEMSYFLSKIDVFVSLHRSEGFGRLIAEAMLLGTPVICTAWSGNMDFTDENTATLVDFELVALNSGDYPQAIGSWAEPDIAHASIVMRRAYDVSLIDTKRLGCARERISSQYSRAAVSKIVASRIGEVSKNIVLASALR